MEGRVSIYLSIGIGFYMAAAVIRKHTFSRATFTEILRGFILGIFLWPFAAVILWRSTNNRNETVKHD